MAKATRCPKCGLMQMGMSAQCTKCGSPLVARAVVPGRAPVAAPGDVNPYAPPRASIGGVGSQAPEGVWRDGKTLVVSHDADLPDRCVKCNQRADGYRLKRRLAWHPSGWYALVLIYLIAPAHAGDRELPCADLAGDGVVELLFRHKLLRLLRDRQHAESGCAILCA